MEIDEAREYLKAVMSDRFTDRTFDSYISRDLAGDFAVEIATTIKALDSEVNELTTEMAECKSRCYDCERENNAEVSRLTAENAAANADMGRLREELCFAAAREKHADEGKLHYFNLMMSAEAERDRYKDALEMIAARPTLDAAPLQSVAKAALAPTS